MEDIIYEDEILPELEIDVLLTLEQMIEYQPRFVAFSRQDIHTYLQQLLGSSKKATQFASLHKSVLEPPEPSIFARYITELERINVEDDDSAFIEQYDDAKKAPNFSLQQLALQRVFYPFRTEAPIGDAATLQDTSDIELTDGSFSRFLRDDPKECGVRGAVWEFPRRTPIDYVFDTTISFNWDTKRAMLPPNTHDIPAWIMKDVRPSFHALLAPVQTWVDFHTLQRIMFMGAFDLYQLHEDDFRALREHLESLPEMETSAETEDDTTHALLQPSFVSFSTVPSLEDVLESEQRRASVVLEEAKRQRKQDQYSIILQTIPPLPGDTFLASPFEIASDLRNGTTTHEEITSKLTQWYQRWYLDTVTKFMERYNENEADPDVVIKFISMWKKIKLSANEMSQFHFVNVYTDMAEVKEGNDTNTYDGSPAVHQQEMYEDVTTDDFAPLQELTGTVPSSHEQTYLAAIAELENVEDGQKEVLMCGVDKLHRIMIVSGISTERIKEIMSWAKQYIARASRIQQLMQQTNATVPEVVLRRVISDDLSVSLQRIQDLHAEEWRNSLLGIYKQVHQEWREACNDTFLLLFTRWWHSLCDRSLHGALSFSPLQGMIQHISSWSSFGPPMEPDAKSGILYYITDVAASLYKNEDAHTLRGEMKRISGDKLKENETKLIEKWNEVRMTEQIMKKADHARLMLENMIRALKEKQKVDVLAGYVPALLYLPHLLPGGKKNTRKAAGWIQGCCASVLDETFKADGDWKTQLSALYKIKQYLAKERWTTQKRVKMETFPKKEMPIDISQRARGMVPTRLDVVVQDGPDNASLSFTDWNWMPRSHMVMLQERPNEVEGWVRSILEQVYSRVKIAQLMTILNRTTNISSFFSIVNQMTTRWDMNISDDVRAKVKAIKQSIENMPTVASSKGAFLYSIITIMLLPGTIDGQRVTLPEGVTTAKASSVWNTNMDICVEWNKNGFMMDAAEIQAFITSIREVQKELSLERLDVLSIEDRQVLLDAKNLGLLRVVEHKEVQVRMPNAAANADDVEGAERDIVFETEGEAEFRMPSTDPDDMEDIL